MERATPFHAAAMAVIHADAFPAGRRWSAATMALQLAAPGAFGWVSEAGGFVLARVAADEAEVLTLAVVAAARRLGLGRRLLEQAMATACSGGASTMVLEVGAANLGGQALYAGAGFATVGRRRRYYEGGEDALIMRVMLEPPACG